MMQYEENNDGPQSSIITSVHISEIPSKPFKLTLEFPMLLTMMAISLSGTAITNVLLYRTCLYPLYHTEIDCRQFLLPSNHNITTDLETEVQKYTTYVTTTKLVVESLVPAVLSLFLGGWSDTHGRKPLIVWPLFGMCVTSMLVVVYAMMDNLGPWWYVIIAIPYSLSGGFTSLFTGAFCYISDITCAQKRSIRLTIIELSFAAGSIIGGLASSYLLKAIGTVYLLLVISLIHVIAYAYTNICLPESLTGAVKGGLLTLLDISLVKDMINTCFKKRPNYGRAAIFNLTIANSMAIFILYGLLNLDYLYTRTKLNWSMRDYTIYNAVSTSASVAGALLGVILLQRVLKITDLTVSVIAFLSCIADYMIKTFATMSWQMYMGSTISSLRNLATPLVRSYLTKTVPVEDIAQVFALMCALEATMGPLIAPPVYNALYNSTISNFPGAVYVLSSALTGVSVVSIGVVIYHTRRANTSTYQPLQTEGNT